MEDEVEEEPEPEYEDPFGMEDNFLEPSSVDEFSIIEDYGKRKRDGLVQERIISVSLLLKRYFLLKRF